MSSGAKWFWSLLIGFLAAAAIGSGLNLWLHSVGITIIGVLAGIAIGIVFYESSR